MGSVCSSAELTPVGERKGMKSMGALGWRRMDLGKRGDEGTSPWLPSRGTPKDGSTGKYGRSIASSRMCTAASCLPPTGVEKLFSLNEESAGAVGGVPSSSA